MSSGDTPGGICYTRPVSTSVETPIENDERRDPKGASCASGRAWPKHRILFLLAGTFTLTGTALAAAVNPWFALLPAMVGANQLLLVATGWCPASSILDRILPAAGA